MLRPCKPQPSDTTISESASAGPYAPNSPSDGWLRAERRGCSANTSRLSAPTLDEYGQAPLGSFAVLSANTKGVLPAMGSFGSWPNPEAFEKFHRDERFLAVKEQRDAALSMLSDGHFLEAKEQLLEVDTQQEYALLIADHAPLHSEPTFEMSVAEDTRNSAYAGKTLSFHPWTEVTEALSQSDPAELEVYRIRFNAPRA